LILRVPVRCYIPWVYTLQYRNVKDETAKQRSYAYPS
jgi:hypothetical protein